MCIRDRAGEEGDKYITLALMEYKAAGVRYVAIQTPEAPVKEEQAEPPKNPSVTENKMYTVQKNDTLWGIAKRFYGNGAQYPKIVAANPGIKNPNLIYPGQVFQIPV